MNLVYWQSFTTLAIENFSSRSFLNLENLQKKMETSFKHGMFKLETCVHFLGNFTRVNAVPATSMEILEIH